jgi:hypothetical protein
MIILPTPPPPPLHSDASILLFGWLIIWYCCQCWAVEWQIRKDDKHQLVGKCRQDRCWLVIDNADGHQSLDSVLDVFGCSIVLVWIPASLRHYDTTICQQMVRLHALGGALIMYLVVAVVLVSHHCLPVGLVFCVASILDQQQEATVLLVLLVLLVLQLVNDSGSRPIRPLRSIDTYIGCIDISSCIDQQHGNRNVVSQDSKVQWCLQVSDLDRIQTSSSIDQQSNSSIATRVVACIV